MIKFTVRESMLDPDMLILSYTIEGDKRPKSKKIEKENLLHEKESIVKFELMRILRELYIQREQVYLHSGHRREQTVLACAYLKEKLSYSFFPTMPHFFAYILKELQPHFRAIMPPVNSRYRNWEPRLNHLILYSEKCYQYFVDRQKPANLQNADLQHISNLEASATCNHVST